MTLVPRLFLSLTLSFSHLFYSSSTEAAAVTISAFELRADQRIPVSGEITGTNSVTLFFSASVQDLPSSLYISAPLQSTPLGGSSGGASIQVFDSGIVTVSYYASYFPAPGEDPVATTNFTVKLLDPLILSVAIQDKVGRRDFTGTNNIVEAADFAEVSLSSKYPERVIYYSTDGSNPSVLSHRYFGPVKVSANTDCRAVLQRRFQSVPTAARTDSHCP